MTNTATTILTRRAGNIIRVTTHGEVIAEATKPVIRKVKAKFSIEDRANIAEPTRRDLTKKQFQEWSESLRNLRQNDYLNAHIMSLNDMRDALRSFTLCQARILLFEAGRL